LWTEHCNKSSCSTATEYYLDQVSDSPAESATVQYSGCNTDIVLGDAGIQAGGKEQSSAQTSGSVWHCLIICHIPRLFLEALI